MRVHHHLVLHARQVADLRAPAHARVAVARGGGLEEAEPGVLGVMDESLWGCEKAEAMRTMNSLLYSRVAPKSTSWILGRMISTVTWSMQASAVDMQV